MDKLLFNDILFLFHVSKGNVYIKWYTRQLEYLNLIKWCSDENKENRLARRRAEIGLFRKYTHINII